MALKDIPKEATFEMVDETPPAEKAKVKVFEESQPRTRDYSASAIIAMETEALKRAEASLVLKKKEIAAIKKRIKLQQDYLNTFNKK